MKSLLATAALLFTTAAWANPAPHAAWQARRDASDLLDRIEAAQKIAPIELSPQLEAAHARLSTSLEQNWGFGCGATGEPTCPTDPSFVRAVRAFRQEVAEITARVTVAGR